MSGATGHVPVLADEAVDALVSRPEGCYLDATFGRGGHAARILERLAPGGRLVAIDRDPAAVAAARERFGTTGSFRIWQGNFADLDEALAALGCTEPLAGILLDLGVSSPQLDDPARGFSFRADGPLDMRMDPGAGPSAAAWLAQVPEAELASVLRTLGEERFARRIARAVVAARAATAIERTGQLAELIASAVPTREPGKHPATRSFQAIRMVVNDELGALERALAAAVPRLAPGGRLAVISFHSLEDRLVKRFFAAQAKAPAGNRRLPAPTAAPRPLALVGKAIRPGARELAANPRARSAILRVAEKRHGP